MNVLSLIVLLAIVATAALIVHRRRERRLLSTEVAAGYTLADLINVKLAAYRATYGTATMAVNDLVTRADAQQLMPEEVSRDIIKALPQSSLAMSRFRTLPMSRKQTRMPVLSSLAQAYFVSGDTGLKQTTKEAWAGKILEAEEIAVIVPIPQAVLDDTEYDLFEEIKPDLIEAAGALIDAAVLFGTSKPTSWGPAIVPGAAAAGNTVTRGAVAGRNLAGDVNAVMRTVASDGHPITGFAADSLLEYDLQGLTDADGRPVFTTNLQEGAAGKGLYGRPFTYLNNGAWNSTQADLIAGDWSQAILGMRQDITFSVHTDGVISDAAGVVVLNLMQQDSAALRMVMRVGYQVANPINRRGVADAARFPFGALRPVGFVGA